MEATVSTDKVKPAYTYRHKYMFVKKSHVWFILKMHRV